jgi:hypothetical protein
MWEVSRVLPTITSPTLGLRQSQGASLANATLPRPHEGYHRNAPNPELSLSHHFESWARPACRVQSNSDSEEEGLSPDSSTRTRGIAQAIERLL